MLRIQSIIRFYARRPKNPVFMPVIQKGMTPFTLFKSQKMDESPDLTLDDVKQQWKSMRLSEKNVYKYEYLGNLMAVRDQIREILAKESPTIAIPVNAPKTKFFYSNYSMYAKEHPNLSPSELKAVIDEAYSELDNQKKKTYSLVGKEKFMLAKLNKDAIEMGLKNLSAYKGGKKVHAIDVYRREFYNSQEAKKISSFGEKTKLFLEKFAALSAQEKAALKEKAETQSTVVEVSPIDFEGQLLAICARLEEELGPKWLSIRKPRLSNQTQRGNNPYVEFAKSQKDVWDDKTTSFKEKMQTISDRYQKSKK